MITAATLTSVIVFLPLIFNKPSEMNIYLKELGITVCVHAAGVAPHQPDAHSARDGAASSRAKAHEARAALMRATERAL